MRPVLSQVQKASGVFVFERKRHLTVILRITLMYAKIFASLYQGTLRGCAHEILVFTNLIAHADSTGAVDKHFRAIADETGLTVEQVKTAITNLESPDPESRSPEFEGRRIIPLDEHRAWGWQIVNHTKYRDIRSEEDRREQNRLAQQRYRERQKARDDDSNQRNAYSNPRNDDVSTRKQDKPMQMHMQIQEAEEEKKVLSDTTRTPARKPQPPITDTRAEAIYRKVFPDVVLSIGQAETFELIDFLDESAFEATCRLWQANNHNAHHLGNLIDRYQNDLKKAEASHPKPKPKLQSVEEVVAEREKAMQIGARPGQ